MVEVWGEIEAVVQKPRVHSVRATRNHGRRNYGKIPNHSKLKLVITWKKEINSELELELELQVVAVASLPKEIAAGLQPKQNNSIRGLLLQSGWVVEKLQNDSCIVTYIAQVSLSCLLT